MGHWRKNVTFSSALDLLAQRRTSYQMARTGLAFVGIPLNLIILARMGAADLTEIFPQWLGVSALLFLMVVGSAFLFCGVRRYLACRSGLDALAEGSGDLSCLIYGKD